MSKLILSLAVLSLLLQSTVFPLSAEESDIAKIDSNFAVEKKGTGELVVYMNALLPPFKVEGFPWYKNGEALNRLPQGVKKSEVNKGVLALSKHTAGGCVRFRTNSPYIYLKSSLANNSPNMGHMPHTGSSGFDLFVDGNTYVKTVNPAHYKGKIPDPLEVKIAGKMPKAMREFTLYMPLYNGVKSLEIGLAPGSKIEAPRAHKISKPILFYGSSITQGACASRTSNAYTAMLCRKLDAPMINFGFSGSALGEAKMAELIASLDLSLFVMDYDYNAPNAEHLWRTHEKFFNIIRQAHPKLPIVIFSRVTNATDERTQAVCRTYENARKNGDNYVWFVDGRDLMKGVDSSYTSVDGTHPNDLGFYAMYKNALPVIEEALKSSDEPIGK